MFNSCREGFLLTYVEISMLIASKAISLKASKMSCITEAMIKWQASVKIFRTKLAVYECSILKIGNEALLCPEIMTYI